MVTKLLGQVWIPNFKNHLVLSPVERKVQVVAMTRLMCESAEVRWIQGSGRGAIGSCECVAQFGVHSTHSSLVLMAYPGLLAMSKLPGPGSGNFGLCSDGVCSL